MGATAYKITGGTRAQGEHVILFESRGRGRALSGRNLRSRASDLEGELEPVAAMAKAVLASVQGVAPGKVAIEFGVELGGKVGIPMVTEGTAKAHLKVTLTWDRSNHAS